MTAPITSNEPTTTRLHHYAGHYFGWWVRARKSSPCVLKMAQNERFMACWAIFFAGEHEGTRCWANFFAGDPERARCRANLFAG